MNKPSDPANFLAHELAKIADGCAKAKPETNEQFHERMAAIARAAFRVPEQPFINDRGENDYDGDMGREDADYMERR